MNRTLLAFMLAVCSAVSAQPPSYVPSDGLVGWYPFDGNALDESGHLFHGTAQGAVLAEDRHGNASSAYHFDGQSHIDLGNFPELNPPYLSISVWFRQDSHNLVSGLSTILGRNLDDGPNRYGYNIGVFGGSSWELSPDEGLRYGFKSVVDSPPTDVDMGGSVPVSAWHHYVAVKDSVDQEIRFYLNGSIVGTQALEIGPTLALDAKTMIGIYRPNGAHAFTGYIDDVGIWNRALSPTEIQTLFTLTPLGCTNEQACNYDTSAIEDDGSCVYPPSLDLGEDIETCEDSVILDAGEGFDYYLWNTGDTVQELITTESFTYNVSASLLGDWIWTSGEELSVSYWNSIVLNPSALCAEMYDSDGFMAESCDLEKYFVLELPDLNEPISDPALAGFTYVDPAYMAAYNAGLTTPLSSNYYLSNEQASFYAAQDICESHGGHLVAINSEAENEFVANIDGAYFGCGNDCDGFWIGLQRAICTVTDEIFVDFDDCDAYCGEGTVWDPINQECIVAIPTDTDFDGCVTAGDVLNLLATFGTCPPIPEWPDEPGDNPWACGDPVTYWDYDYATVLIGDQCWFAENVKYLPAVSPVSLGSEDDGQPHAYVYDYNGSDHLAASTHSNYISYGVLYNLEAATLWNLCPSGWHIPDEIDWSNVYLELSPSSSASEAWFGDNSSGFTALPHGNRDGVDSMTAFNNLGVSGNWWLLDGSYRGLSQSGWFEQSLTGDYSTGSAFGLAVRCIKD